MSALKQNCDAAIEERDEQIEELEEEVNKLSRELAEKENEVMSLTEKMKGCTLTNCCLTNLFNVSAGEPLVHFSYLFFFLQSFLFNFRYSNSNHHNQYGKRTQNGC